MDRMNNPFTPGAGAPPPALVGRDQLLEDARVLFGRVKQGKAEKSMLITGLRGVGKTVLLNSMASEAERQGYAIFQIEINASGQFIPFIVKSLRSLLLRLDAGTRNKSAVRKVMAVLKSFLGNLHVSYGDLSIGLDIDPAIGSADSGDLDTDLSELFSHVGELAAEQDTGVAFFIDEVQFLDKKEFGAVIVAMHKMQQKQLPIVLVGAGLPVLYELAGKTKSYTERLFQFPGIGPLTKEEACKAIRIPIEEGGASITEKALSGIYEVTKGYPYFLQEWGYQVWNVCEASPITAETVISVSPRVIQRLDENFFKVRFSRVTPKEKTFLYEMAKLGYGPYKISDIAHSMHTETTSVSPQRSSLIKKGMVYSPSYGNIDFTVPLFNEFMCRAMDEA